MEPRLTGDRLEFDNPWIELCALPLAVSTAVLFSTSGIGSLFLVPFQIQFHELGHAVMAWLSSRAALPLPFGFTFWSEQQSLFTGACMAFLLGVFTLHALRERRAFALGLAVALVAAFLSLSLIPAERSRMLILIAGCAGELLLTTLMLVGFYFPLPDRLRWDFFRFIVLLPAAGSWVSAVALWRGVAGGTRIFPRGSLLGTAGDGSGDMDRLIFEYGFSEHALAGLYGRVALSTVVLLVVTYLVFALRAGRKLGFVPAWD